MYNHYDFDSDRSHVRNEILQKRQHKGSVEEVVRLLDHICIQERAMQFASPESTLFGETPYYAAKDVDGRDFTWSDAILKEEEAVRPNYMEDEEKLRMVGEMKEEVYRDAVAEVDFEDERTDHSVNNLTKNEKKQMQLFHYLKQDPYYKHYIKNYMRMESEFEFDSLAMYPHAFPGFKPQDYVDFDRVNLLDFRRQIPQLDRKAEIYNGYSWGYGKRKTAVALAAVKPGSGKITINRRPLLKYFTIAMQRSTIMKPIKQSGYSALLDVNIYVRGGGWSCQPQAIVPAIAKAIAKFDPASRKVLKMSMRHDTRQVERKKIGLKKARKGRVFRRR